jgi:hypothetical protein
MAWRSTPGPERAPLILLPPGLFVFFGFAMQPGYVVRQKALGRNGLRAFC